MRLGYACINMELQASKPKITCNRGMIRRTFDAKGLPYASELALQNVKDLSEIIKWNRAHGVEVFRMTSCLFPWASEYQLEQLPDYEQICQALKTAGDLAKEFGQRLSFHPGPFNVLSSPKEHVVNNCIKDLEHHGEVMDLLGMPRNRWAKINIHVGASYGDKVSALDRWCNNYERLSDAVTSRLTLENDDKASMYSVVDLVEVPYERHGIPVVFDYHHHRFCDGGLSEKDALQLAACTWDNDVRPTCHYSDSKCIEANDDTIRPQAHSDYIFNRIDTHGLDLDIVLEAKAKERALMRYREEYLATGS
jgi:UV DNA damage endonuclease